MPCSATVPVPLALTVALNFKLLNFVELLLSICHSLLLIHCHCGMDTLLLLVVVVLVILSIY